MKTDFYSQNKDITTVKVSKRKCRFVIIIISLFLIIFVLGLTLIILNHIFRWHLEQENKKSYFVRANMVPVEAAIDMYYKNTNQYPVELNNLTVDPGIPGWIGPYLKPSQLYDPWDNPFIYMLTGKQYPEGYVLISYGVDGKPGGQGYNEDINNK
jgi:general secretion pathway protein G